MKIAQIAPIWFRVPPKKYGGTEQVISALTEGLVEKGHDVTLFATEDSATKAKLVSFFPHEITQKTFSAGKDFFILPLIHMVKSLRLARKFDVVHCHFTTLADFILLALAEGFRNAIFTLHVDLPTKDSHPKPWKAFQTFKDANFVSISNNQKAMDLNFMATVYHGLNPDEYLFTDRVKETDSSGYIFWISRLSKDKGLSEAIEVSDRLSKKLFFAAAINSDSDREYFEKEIVPNIINNENVKRFPELNFNHKNLYFKNSKLFLFPIQWEEPFGLVMIESMATGTPVVAFARGSVPEVVKDGETGFIVNSSDDDIRGDWVVKKTGIDGLCEAVERIYSTPENEYRQMRRNCRSHVEENFTVEKMVDEYEKVYRSILKGWLNSISC